MPNRTQLPPLLALAGQCLDRPQRTNLKQLDVHDLTDAPVVRPSGELEITVGGEPKLLKTGGVAHVPAGVAHAYTNLSEAHFLTIVSKGNAAKLFKQVSCEVEMSPPDLPGVLRVAAEHAIEFVL